MIKIITSSIVLLIILSAIASALLPLQVVSQINTPSQTELKVLSADELAAINVQQNNQPTISISSLINSPISKASDVKLLNIISINTEQSSNSISSSTQQLRSDSSIGTLKQSLKNVDKFLQGLDELSKELHVSAKTVSGDTTTGKTFTITVTAADADDLVTKITLGKAPYANSDYTPKDCNPQSNLCTIVFSLSESTPGTYTYMIKAKNIKGEIVNDAITVNVVKNVETNSFTFRTAAMDGAKYDNSIISYINSNIKVWADGYNGILLAGSPFANFNVPSNTMIAAKYDATGYTSDTDYFYFDSRLPSCSGSTCSFTKTVNTTQYTTTCNLVVTDYHYACTLSNADGYSIGFDFRATNDPLGPNTIRRYNLLYKPAAPIVNFAGFDANFEAGSSLKINLDNYVTDADTQKQNLVWSTQSTNLKVSIDSSSKEATITQKDKTWIGNEFVKFTAKDPEGNSDSDTLTVRVLKNNNNPPVIISTNPDGNNANVGKGSSRQFSITAIDPEYDLLTITWKKGTAILATNTFNYKYLDTDAKSSTLTVTVSDGTEQVSQNWNINIVQPIGTITGTITNAATGNSLKDVIVTAYEIGTAKIANTTSTDLNGIYSMMVHDGTYDLTFQKTDYYDKQATGIIVYAGETIIVDQQLAIIPPPIGTITGTVSETGTNTPIEGATVTVYVAGTTTVANTTSTDATGKYSVVVNNGNYDLKIEKTGYTPYTLNGISITTGIIVTKDAQLSLIPQPIGTITGTVTDFSSGSIISGATVTVYVASTTTVANTTYTDGSGKYSLNLLNGIYDLKIEKTGYVPYTSNGITITTGLVVTKDAQLKINTAPIGTIQGTVTDVDNTLPLSGVLVQAMNGVTVVNSTSTDVNGQYRMDVHSGNYDVQFSKLNYDTKLSTGIVITTGLTTTIDSTLQKTIQNNGVLQGKVTDEKTGTAVGGVLVELISSGSVVKSMTTSATGDYTLSTIIIGTYDVKFSKTGYKTETKTSISVTPSTSLNFILMRWWNSEWQKKYPITVNAVSSSPYRPFQLVFNSSVITMSDCQADGGDVRIVNEMEDGLEVFNLAVWNSTTGIVYVNESLQNAGWMGYLYCGATTSKSSASVAIAELALLEDITAYYKFDEVNTSKYSDATGNGHHMTRQNAITIPNGKIGKGMVIQNAQNWNITTLRFESPPGVTVAFWVNGTYSGATHRNIFTQQRNCVGSQSMYFAILNGGFYTQDSDDAAHTCGAGTLMDGVGYFITMWANSTGWYVRTNNGTICQSDTTFTTGTPSCDNSYFMNVGSNPAIEIDELNIWNRSISVSESDLIYNNNTGTTYPFVALPSNMVSTGISY